jgi:hypothetical protein
MGNSSNPGGLLDTLLILHGLALSPNHTEYPPTSHLDNLSKPLDHSIKPGVKRGTEYYLHPIDLPYPNGVIMSAKEIEPWRFFRLQKRGSLQISPPGRKSQVFAGEELPRVSRSRNTFLVYSSSVPLSL